MSQTQVTLTKEEAIERAEKLVAWQLDGALECDWKDHWQAMLECGTPEDIAALELLAGCNIEDVKSYDLNFQVSMSVTYAPN